MITSIHVAIKRTAAALKALVVGSGDGKELDVREYGDPGEAEELESGTVLRFARAQLDVIAQKPEAERLAAYEELRVTLLDLGIPRDLEKIYDDTRASTQGLGGKLLKFSQTFFSGGMGKWLPGVAAALVLGGVGFPLAALGAAVCVAGLMGVYLFRTGKIFPRLLYRWDKSARENIENRLGVPKDDILNCITLNRVLAKVEDEIRNLKSDTVQAQLRAQLTAQVQRLTAAQPAMTALPAFTRRAARQARRTARANARENRKDAAADAQPAAP